MTKTTKTRPVVRFSKQGAALAHDAVVKLFDSIHNGNGRPRMREAQSIALTFIECAKQCALDEPHLQIQTRKP